VTLAGPVILGSNVTIDTDAPAADGNIKFTSSINGAQSLSLTAGAGNLLIGGPVGDTIPLSSFSATANSIAAPAITTTGNIALTSTSSLTINTLTSTAGGIDLTSTAGSILDGYGATNNLTSAADSTLRALGGVVGLLADPIEVNINPGALGVAATGQIAGVSVHINGTVLPSDTLTLLNLPPGLVIFNGLIVGGGNVEDLLRATSDLDLRRVNEFGPFTKMLLYVLGDTYFEEKRENCELDEDLTKKLKTKGCYSDQER